MLPRPTIEAFDRHLFGLGLRFEGVVIGGSALGLMGIIQRPTRDFDILVPVLPAAIVSAARDFALGDVLPAGWRERVQGIFDGQALVLSTLGRPDLLKSKLFALCDRGTDLPDCIALAPTAGELAESLPWLEVQDGNELWPAHVRATITDLARRLDHGICRATAPETMPAADELTARMVGIGMSFAAKPQSDADIESTLLYASVVGMDEGDLRVLAVLTTWLGVHHTHVNADRLVRLVDVQRSKRVRAYWEAIATWLKKDRRLARLAGAYEGAPIELLPTGTAFQIKRRGEDGRFVDSCLRVPSGTLRERADDVLGPEALVRRHAGYRNRVLMGPSFRADVWTVLEKTPDLSVADVARRASCSFATAWQAVQDFRLLRAATSRA